MADKVISAVLVDDHVAIAAGVGSWFSLAEPPIVLLNAGDRLPDLWTGPGARADVVIFDLELVPRQPNFGELRRLVKNRRRVVVYSQHADQETALRCVDLGALAYLTKREGEEHLVPAVRAAAEGRSYTAPTLSGVLVTDERPERPSLTPREREVLRAWFVSSSKDLVARKLDISAKTVETHIERVRAKYAHVGRAAPTKSDLVSHALDDGLITLDELTAQRDV
ncbi:LuxR family transcriptional regulator [Actinophytocola xinjiangensis]|uniref:LuxR family transcriptional regulator n=1 Tax=Actinophytocola xinjiangensis TaxID=485602 RepID=A0A7Z0WME4_9PSEU|nr:response regulator transcription factor [Actinophytocola xinjiangensis]OLF09665.1 LuxR family transcriptional regulator [Actinophytocola xinjiangensis]